MRADEVAVTKGNLLGTLGRVTEDRGEKVNTPPNQFGDSTFKRNNFQFWLDAERLGNALAEINVVALQFARRRVLKVKRFEIAEHAAR